MIDVKNLLTRVRRYVSPVYITMLVASFLLWYITKLGETYTTDHEVTIVVEDIEVEVDCTIRGKGTDLIGYTFSSRRSRFDIPASEIVDNVTTDNQGRVVRHVNSMLLQQALAARMSDITIVSVGAVAPIKDMRSSRGQCKLDTTMPSAEGASEQVSKYDVVPATLDARRESAPVLSVEERADSLDVVASDSLTVAVDEPLEGVAEESGEPSADDVGNEVE